MGDIEDACAPDASRDGSYTVSRSAFVYHAGRAASGACARTAIRAGRCAAERACSSRITCCRSNCRARTARHGVDQAAAGSEGARRTAAQ